VNQTTRPTIPAAATGPAGRLPHAVDTAPATCPAYTWCAVRGEHVTHTSDILHAPAGHDTHTLASLDFFLMADDGAPLIGFCDADYTLEQYRAKVAEIRAHLDRADARAAAAFTTKASQGNAR
jgi:hypothetical protein